MNQEKEFSTKVSTLAQTEQALKRMDSLESNAQVSVVQSYFYMYSGISFCPKQALSLNQTLLWKHRFPKQELTRTWDETFPISHLLMFFFAKTKYTMQDCFHMRL